MEDLERRARRHAALGEPIRLAIVDDLAVTDRSPGELVERFGVATNLLAHHLDVLEGAGLIERFVSAGDRRRRYVRLVRSAEMAAWLPTVRPYGPVVFVCTGNSARSQLAAALWSARTGGSAGSAGTHPAERVHPGAVAAARRAGLDLGQARPRTIGAEDFVGLVVTVCDRAHEELTPGPSWWHWSVPDPVADGSARAFDAALAHLDRRITALVA